MFWLHPASLAFSQNVTEYQVKAAYVYNFAKLAGWSNDILPDSARLVICVAGGDDRFVNALKTLVEGKTIATHAMTVEHVTSADHLKPCHVIFFRASERDRTQAAIAGVDYTNVLLVGEDADFLRQGGMINLIEQSGKIRFQVDYAALDRSNIHFSSRLLMLAKAENSSSPDVAREGSSRQIKLRVRPEYPELAQRLNVKGPVQVQAFVSPDGNVREVTVIGGHPVLAQAVAEAVKKWKYQPASRETVEVVRFSF